MSSVKRFAVGCALASIGLLVFHGVSAIRRHRAAGHAEALAYEAKIEDGARKYDRLMGSITSLGRTSTSNDRDQS